MNFDRLQTSLGNSELEGSECLVWEESCLDKLLLGEGEQRSIDLTRNCEESKVVWWVCTNCFCCTTKSTKFSKSFWNEWGEGFCFDSDTRIANKDRTSTSVLGKNEDLGRSSEQQVGSLDCDVCCSEANIRSSSRESEECLLLRRYKCCGLGKGDKREDRTFSSRNEWSKGFWFDSDTRIANKDRTRTSVLVSSCLSRTSVIEESATCFPSSGKFEFGFLLLDCTDA